MVTSIVFLMDAAILDYPDAFLVHDHIVKSPAEIKTTAAHKMRPICELLLQWVQVTVGVYEP